MATAYHNLSSYDADTMPDASGMKVAIAAANGMPRLPMLY